MATKSRTSDLSTNGNQLSLFSEVTDAELGDNLIEESIDGDSRTALQIMVEHDD